MTLLSSGSRVSVFTTSPTPSTPRITTSRLLRVLERCRGNFKSYLVKRDVVVLGVEGVGDVVDVLAHQNLPIVRRLGGADALQKVEGELRKLVRELGFGEIEDCTDASGGAAL